MGYPSPDRSEAELVTEGFPPDAYRELRRRILSAGWLLMPWQLHLATQPELDGPLAPSTVVYDTCIFDEIDMTEPGAKPGTKPVVHDMALAMTFRFGANKRNRATLLGCTATLSAVETYLYEPYRGKRWELWDSRFVALRSRGREVQYKRSVSVGDEGARVVFDDMPRRRRDVGTDLAGLRARKLEQGMEDDYRWILRGLDKIIEDEVSQASQAEGE